MSQLVLTEYAQQHLVTDATQAASGVAGILNGAKAALYVNNFAPLPSTLLADLTLSPDAGLVVKTITWGTAYRRQVGGIAIDGGVLEFQLADAVNATIVYGWYLVDSGGTHLLGAEKFDNPQNLGDILAAVGIVPQVAFGGPDQGEVTILS